MEKADIVKFTTYRIAHELEEMSEKNRLELDDLDMKKNMPEILIRLGRQEALQSAIDCINRIKKEMLNKAE